MRRFAALLAATMLTTAAAAGEGLAPAAERAGLHLGVALGPRQLAAQADLVARDFTSLTAENAMKWGALARRSPRYDFSAADAVVAFAEANGLRLRGHALLWSRLNGMPGWLRAHLGQVDDPEAEVRRLVTAHIALVVGRYRGRIAQWDVVNEPLALDRPALDPDNPFVRHGGEALLADAFRMAAAADPEAELFLNEVHTESAPARFDALLDLVARLRAAGAPIDGVGLQGHYQTRPPDGPMLRDQIERLAALGVRVEITELDIPLRLFAAAEDPEAAQADAYRAVVAACLAVPACTGLTIWGLGDGDSWLGAEERPLLLDAEYRPKPAWHAVHAALKDSAE